MYVNTMARYLGNSVAPRGCADANTGLLINCWKTAVQRGLGMALDQAQLSRVATAYQRIVSPRRLAGCGLGDDSASQTPWIVPPSYVTAPNPLTIAASQPPAKQPTWLTNWINTPTLPTVTPDVLLAAAQLPNAPATVKAAAAQLPASSWFTAQMITGIPNYLLLGGGGVVLFMLFAGGRRRR